MLNNPPQTPAKHNTKNTIHKNDTLKIDTIEIPNITTVMFANINLLNNASKHNVCDTSWDNTEQRVLSSQAFKAVLVIAIFFLPYANAFMLSDGTM